MQDEESIKIVKRFFIALDDMRRSGEVRGLATFTKEYGINRRNLVTLRKEPQRDIFKLVWLKYLVDDFNFNPEWLITGKGSRRKK